MTETNLNICPNVSRETRLRLELYAGLLVKWNARMNLLGSGEIERLWPRHINDSLQLLKLIPDTAKTFVDIGSGAGFPGLILAIALRDRPGAEFTLIESNGRKCAFLREAARITKAPVRVINRRIEDFKPGELSCDILTARALAPVEKLLAMAQIFLGINSQCLFLKGQYVDDELTAAAKCWNISLEIHPSITDPTGRILVIGDIQPRSGCA